MSSSTPRFDTPADPAPVRFYVHLTTLGRRRVSGYGAASRYSLPGAAVCLNVMPAGLQAKTQCQLVSESRVNMDLAYVNASAGRIFVTVVTVALPRTARAPGI